MDTFPAICNHSDSTYDNANSRGFSSLITINHQNNKEEMNLRKENLLLKNELQETKDHMELLEFRILEFTEDQKTSQTKRCDQGTSTDECSDIQPEAKYNLSSQNNHVSKEYLQEYHKQLLNIYNSTDYKSIRSSNLQTFLDLKEQLNKFGQFEPPMSLDIKPAMEMVTETPDFLPSHDKDKKECILNCSLHYEKKLVEYKSNEIDILVNLDALAMENRELHNLVTTLSESHETQTEASETESELVHDKTPSISSEISDTECDVLPKLRDMKIGIHNATSLQESGIFESQCDLIDATTQTFEDDDEETVLIVDANQSIEKSDIESSSLNSQHMDNIPDMNLKSSVDKFVNVQKVNTKISLEDGSEFSLHDLQESDEYLLGYVEDRVILSKTEYDNIVAEERTLQVKLEELNAEYDEITLKCSDSEARLKIANSKTSTTDEKESMRGAVRVLEEKLRSAEKHSKQFFEEKCEYEEAENDARLMVQRLQSQLDAAQETEALIRDSLSQEQEFSRELQNCLRDMQVDERETKIQEENYLRENKMLLEREKLFMSETQLLKVHYFLLIFNLLVKEYFKRGYRPKTLEITDGSKSFKDECDSSTKLATRQSSFKSRLQLISQSPLNLSCLLPTLNTRMCTYNNKLQYKLSKVNINADMNEHSLMEAPVNSTDQCDTDILSDREKFYLQQIEVLQQEKKNLRNHFENNDTERYQLYVSCRNELESTRNVLELSESEKCKFLFKIEELQYDLQSAKDTNESRIENMRLEFSSICDTLRREKQDIASHYEARFNDLKKLRRSQEIKVKESNRRLTSIHLQLAPYIDDSIRNGSQDNSIDDIIHLSNLVKSEATLRDTICELQEKERAYMETIAEADKIMSAHVTSYNKHISELESKLNGKKSIFSNLKDVIQLMKEKLSGKGSSLNPSELQDLFCKLDFSLINNFNEGNFLDITEIEGNDDEKTLDSEFYEKEELLQKLLKLTTHNSSLSSQLQEAHESTRKMSEMLQNENYFRSRVEELECSETCLREDLKRHENVITQKERKYEDKVNLLKDEIYSIRIEMEDANSGLHHAEKSENEMKKELTEMKNVIVSLKSELQELSDENVNNDSQHRLEVARLRYQLNVVNKQLIEIGGINGELQENIISSKNMIKEGNQQLEEKTKSYEADVLSLNLNISLKDNYIEEMEAQMQQLKYNEAVNELDGLSSLPFTILHNTLKEICKGLQDCSKCSEDYSKSIDVLMEYSETFTQLINGRTTHSDSDSEGEKLKYCNTTKSPLQNGNHLLEEEMNKNLCRLADIYPCVPPRPRRDAKLKRKWKRGSTNEESILHELQETMKDAKKSSPAKNKTKEMKENIKILAQKVKLTKEELQLADIEVTELYSKLASENETIQMKQIEISNIQDSMVTFRREYLATIEKNEKSRQDTDQRHKEEIEEMNKVISEMKIHLSTEKQHTKEKNHLLKYIIEVIRSEICRKKMYIILTAILKCTFHPEISKIAYTNEMLREDVEYMITQLSTNQEVMNETICSEYKCLSESPDNDNKNNLIKIKTSSITHLAGTIKSKIPILQPLYISNLKEKMKLTDVIKDSIVITKPAKHLELTKKPLSLLKQTRKQNITNSIKKKIDAVFNDDKNIYPTRNRSHIYNNGVTLNNKKEIVENKKISMDFTFTEENIPKNNRLATTQKILSAPNHCYRRSLKRALPIQVDNSSAKELSLHSAYPRKSSKKEEKYYDVPRPQNLKITRRVGTDGAVIAWSLMENDCIAGFQVMVNGKVTQQVRSPKRTKALVNGLTFCDDFNISLATISNEGRCSIPVTVTYRSHTVAKRKGQFPKDKCPKTIFTCFSP